MDELEDILYDGADVEYQLGSIQLQGYNLPIMCLFDSGPHWSTMAMTAEYNDLRFRVAAVPGLDKEPRLILYQEGKILAPILTTFPDEDLGEFSVGTKAGKPWVLAIQFKIEDEEKTILWLTQGPEGQESRTKSIVEPYLDRWIFPDG